MDPAAAAAAAVTRRRSHAGFDEAARDYRSDGTLSEL